MSDVVRRNGTGIAILSTGATHEAKLYYSWLITNPLVVVVTIEISLASMQVKDGGFGQEGLSCSKCHVALCDDDWYIPVEITPQIDELWCLSCGHNQPGSCMSKQGWEISAEMIARALNARTDFSAGETANVRIWRTDEDQMRWTFRQGANLMYLTTNVLTVESMLKEIRQISRNHKGGRIENEYLESGLADLEAMANGTL